MAILQDFLVHSESSGVAQLRHLAADGDGAALWTLLECTRATLSEEEIATGVVRVGEALRKNAEEGGEAHKILHATFVAWGTLYCRMSTSRNAYSLMTQHHGHTHSHKPPKAYNIF